MRQPPSARVRGHLEQDVEHPPARALGLVREGRQLVLVVEELRDHDRAPACHHGADDRLRDRAHGPPRSGEVVGPSADGGPEDVDVEEEPSGPRVHESSGEGGLAAARQAVQEHRGARSVHARPPLVTAAATAATVRLRDGGVVPRP
jgi:hypothetical protein